MGEKLPVPRLFETVPRDRVPVVSRHAGDEFFLDEFVRGEHGGVRLFELPVLPVVPEQEGAGDVRAIPVHLAAEVDEDLVAEFKFGVPRLVMGHGGVRAEGDDRVEGGGIGAQPAHVVFEQRRDLRLRHPLSDLGQKPQKALFGDVARPGDRVQFPIVFHRHRGAEGGHAVHEGQPQPFQLFVFGIGGEFEGDAHRPVLLQKRRGGIVEPIRLGDLHFRALKPLFRRFGIPRVGVHRRALFVGDDESALRQKARDVSLEIFRRREHGIRAHRLKNFPSVCANHK